MERRNRHMGRGNWNQLRKAGGPVANGDKASSKGWTVFPNTQAHSLGYDDINYAMDRTADEADARIAADTALQARTPKITIRSAPLTSADSPNVGDLRFYWS